MVADDNAFGMDSLHFRKDTLAKRDILVKEAASVSSSTGSHEVIVGEGVNKNGRIIKTTHFVVQEADIVPEQRRWSNI